MNDRVYVTTFAVRNDRALDAVCETAYTPPGDAEGRVLRASYDVPAGMTHVDEGILLEAGAAGTLRVVCSDDVAVAVRIRVIDGAGQLEEGRVFAGLSEEKAIRGSTPLTLHALHDVVIEEVGGKAVTLEAVVRNESGRELVRKTYEVPALGQQIVNLTKVHAIVPITAVELHIVSGEGAIVAADETRDPAVLDSVSSMTPEFRAAAVGAAAKARTMTQHVPNLGVIRQLGVGAAAFQAGPFQEPMTGKINFRERWLDPRTGTWLSADPMGYRDSANLFSFAGGDPVNRRDPTGMDDADIAARQDPALATFFAAAERYRLEHADSIEVRAARLAGRRAAVRDQAAGAAIGLLPGTGYIGPLMAAGHVVQVTRRQGLRAGAGAAFDVWSDQLKGLPFVNWHFEGEAASDAHAEGDAYSEEYHRTVLGLRAAGDSALLIGLTEATTAPRPRITDVRAISADEANQRFLDKGWFPPYKAGSRPRVFVTARQMIFQRVSGPGNVKGAFLVRADEIAGLTPAQIQTVLGLPYEPSLISDVVVPPGTRMQVGPVGRQTQWGGREGAMQYELLGKIPPDNYKNTKPLKP